VAGDSDPVIVSDFVDERVVIRDREEVVPAGCVVPDDVLR
jgi:hypothetical protein